MAVCFAILGSEDVNGRLLHQPCGIVVLGCDRLLRRCGRRGTGPPHDRICTGPNCGAPNAHPDVEATDYR